MARKPGKHGPSSQPHAQLTFGNSVTKKEGKNGYWGTTSCVLPRNLIGSVKLKELIQLKLLEQFQAHRKHLINVLVVFLTLPS